MNRVEKPWGSYEVLRVEAGFQVKRIEVHPGHRLSYQTHARRAEKWTVVRGSGRVILNDREFAAPAGSFFEIPVGVRHRIQNTGSESLIFVEVQLGDYLGEDDIIRLEDDYRRQ